MIRGISNEDQHLLFQLANSLRKNPFQYLKFMCLHLVPFVVKYHNDVAEIKEFKNE